MMSLWYVSPEGKIKLYLESLKLDFYATAQQI